MVIKHSDGASKSKRIFWKSILTSANPEYGDEAAIKPGTQLLHCCWSSATVDTQAVSEIELPFDQHWVIYKTC